MEENSDNIDVINKKKNPFNVRTWIKEKYSYVTLARLLSYLQHNKIKYMKYMWTILAFPKQQKCHLHLALGTNKDVAKIHEKLFRFFSFLRMKL